ncbi:MAG: D-alanyl-D-alanine carboxypeptidase/D-alanyl-D-alanine-endopeptidase [Balneolaceae bacterium]|nr:D-alanyl-D-alanine carboxypeptidase/D-alanyl-D-alanine-endopeptidase [Balneolaceae bacterium]
MTVRVLQSLIVIKPINHRFYLMNFRTLHLLISYYLFLALFFGCQTTSKIADSQPVKEEKKGSPSLVKMVEKSELFSANITGFVLYDPKTDSTLYSLNGNKYFTPASNTKLFTFYAGLKTLPDTLRALEYVVQGDSLIFWGTADPSFLHREYGSDTVYEFLKNRPEDLYYSDSHFQDKPLGAGWSWDDYNSYYSAEKSPFPIYGNMVEFTVEHIEINRIKKNRGEFMITPKQFTQNLEEKAGTDGELLLRDRTGNQFEYRPVADTTTYEVLKPFHYTSELVTDLLADTLGRTVKNIKMEKPSDTRVLYSIPADTAYKRMLQPSDNFIAEQLLLMIASERGEPMNTEKIIEYIIDNYLSDLPDQPQWADGSGLSRYNMFTPRTIVQLLEKIDEEFDSDEKMFELFPAGGETGTIESWYAHREGGAPYVYAKTGTLMNNHCLSGFIITKSGRKLLFSFMNNHYVTPSAVVKEEMEKVLWHIYSSF